MIGQMVSKYRILEVIGRGSMGIVFRAVDTVGGNLVAVKILAEKLADNPEMLHRFAREGGAAAALNHPNICRVYEAGEWNGRPYLALELLTGRTLDAVLAAGPLNAPWLAHIGIGVAGALEAAHAAGVVHRDIKPANLFLTGDGTVKVLDFGLAKVRPPSVPVGDDAPTVVMHITQRNLVIGTLAYMSPEQACSEPLDGRSDLYSLGVAIYELATGRLPQRGAMDPGPLPAGLAPILVRLLAGDPAARYQTAAETRSAFVRWRTSTISTATTAP